MKTLPILVALLALAACAQRGVEVLGATPASITIWAGNTDDILIGVSRVSDATVTDLAQRHCQKYGKNARRHLQSRRYYDREITFDCVD